MKRYLTVDGGTTNTRLYLTENGKITDVEKINGGFNSPDSKERMSIKIRSAVESILERNGLSEKDVLRIIASGMITSDFGLLTVPHTAAPAGICEIRNNSKEILLSDVSSIPFFFISGIKTSSDSPLYVNFMRGEETELFGMMKETDAIYILPGSHNKVISVDKNGRVTDFLSTLSGEMIAALTKNTILSVSLDINSDSPAPGGLLDGYRYTKEYGINEALLKPRALKLDGSFDNAYIYGFFMGAVLEGEISRIVKMKEKKAIIGGRAEIRNALAYLLSELSDKEVIALSDGEVANSTPCGAIKIFESGT